MPIKEVIAEGIMMPLQILNQRKTAYPLSIDFAQHKALAPATGITVALITGLGGSVTS
jgi:hypothetical protein